MSSCLSSHDDGRAQPFRFRTLYATNLGKMFILAVSVFKIGVVLDLPY